MRHGLMFACGAATWPLDLPAEISRSAEIFDNLSRNRSVEPDDRGPSWVRLLSGWNDLVRAKKRGRAGEGLMSARPLCNKRMTHVTQVKKVVP